MSDDKNDGYEPVVGFSIPFRRVLGHEERPENSDGSRSGSLFMTIEGCTFKNGNRQGSAAATVGAPSVVVEVIEGDRDYLTSSKSSSRFIVDVHDIVQVALDAHEARMLGAAPVLDTVEHWKQVAVRLDNEKHAAMDEVTRCSTIALENARERDTLRAQMNPVVLQRLARLVWIRVGKARNPLLDQAMSSGQSDLLVNERFAAWNVAQLELGRALFNVVFNDGAPDLGLINRALDFLES